MDNHLGDQLEKLEVLYEHIMKKTKDETETSIIFKKLELDNPHILKLKSIGEWLGLVDKIILARNIFKKRGESNEME